MKLLKQGQSNWDYYYNPNVKLVVAMAKPNTGASNSFFGTLKYFNKIKEKL